MANFNKFDITFYKIHNPTSSNVGYATVSQITRLKKSFELLYLSVRNNIKTKIFKENDNKFIIVANIPSENLNGITYDVVLEMEKSPNDTSFLHAPLKIFSNDPSYTYNYTWVMNQNGTIPEKLIPKCSTIALTDPPEIRNPLLLFHLHKYSIILRFHILFKGYLNPKYLEKDCEKFISFDSYIQKVPSQEQKIEEIKKKYPTSKYKNLESDIQNENI